MIHKNSKRYQVYHPPPLPLPMPPPSSPWLNAVLGKYKKLTLLDALRWQGFLSACVSMWMECWKIYKVWALINQILPWCFLSYWSWLNELIEWVDISKSIDINQLMSDSQYYPIHALSFTSNFFCFPIIDDNSLFSTHLRRVCH